MGKGETEPLLAESTHTLKGVNLDKMFVTLPLHRELKERYNLLSVAGEGTDFERAISIMQWLTDNTFYSGASAIWNADNGLTILESSFGKGFERAICCRDKAVALIDCLLALGIKAYPISMLSAKMQGCHFTVHCYLKESNEWILLDPSFNTYFKDNDKILNVWDVKKIFLEEREPDIVGYSFNGTTECRDVYIKYFLKQLMTNLATWENSCVSGRKYKKYDWSTKKVFDTALPREV